MVWSPCVLAAATVVEGTHPHCPVAADAPKGNDGVLGIHEHLPEEAFGHTVIERRRPVLQQGPQEEVGLRLGRRRIAVLVSCLNL